MERQPGSSYGGCFDAAAQPIEYEQVPGVLRKRIGSTLCMAMWHAVGCYPNSWSVTLVR